MSPLSAYELPAKYADCPTGGKKPAELPTIRLPEEAEANRKALDMYGDMENQAGRVCRSRLLGLGQLYVQTVRDLLSQIKGQTP